jgi:hypothetical protein
LGVAIGSDVIGFDAGLDSIAGLTPIADQMLYTTGVNTYASTAITVAGRALIDDVDASAQRTTLGVVIGVDVQGYKASLDGMPSTVASGNILYTTGSNIWSSTTITAAGRALLDDTSSAVQRTTLGLDAGGAGDIWIEKAGDTATGIVTIKISNASTTTGNSEGFLTFENTSSAANALSGISFTGQTLGYLQGGIYLNNDGAGGASGSLKFFTRNTSSVVNENMRIKNDGTIQFNAYGAGSLSTDSSGNISASDGRLKTKLDKDVIGKESIMALKPVWYEWNADSPYNSDVPELGFIAQEVAEVIPEAAPGTDDTVTRRNYSDRAIIASLVKHNQELEARISKLEQLLNT